jgi:hypothetical protein
MLEYVALIILLLGLTLVFYGFVYIHDLPYHIAKTRNHPQTEAIHAACWLSLFTLHAIWPIVFIWAISKQGPIPVAMGTGTPPPPTEDTTKRLAELETRLKALEQKTSHKKA